MKLEERITEILASCLSANDVRPRAKEVFDAFMGAGYRKPGAKVRAILTKTVPNIVGGKIIQETSEFEVRIMTIADGYAMVRRKGASPFICSIKDFRT